MKIPYVSFIAQWFSPENLDNRQNLYNSILKFVRASQV